MSTLTSKLQKQAMDLLGEVQIRSHGLREATTKPESLQSANIDINGGLRALQKSLHEAFTVLRDGTKIFRPDLEAFIEFVKRNRLITNGWHGKIETDSEGYIDGLDVTKGSLLDIEPLSCLIHLKGLVLEGNQIQDLTALANLTNLEVLGLTNNQISDISPLANLTKLNNLMLDLNQISDLTPIASLKNLDFLVLHTNFATDYSPLRQCRKLTLLSIDYQPGTDLSFLTSLPALNDVAFYGDTELINGNAVVNQLQRQKNVVVRVMKK